MHYNFVKKLPWFSYNRYEIVASGYKNANSRTPLAPYLTKSVFSCFHLFPFVYWSKWDIVDVTIAFRSIVKCYSVNSGNNQVFLLFSEDRFEGASYLLGPVQHGVPGHNASFALLFSAALAVNLKYLLFWQMWRQGCHEDNGFSASLLVRLIVKANLMQFDIP